MQPPANPQPMIIPIILGNDGKQPNVSGDDLFKNQNKLRDMISQVVSS